MPAIMKAARLTPIHTPPQSASLNSAFPSTASPESERISSMYLQDFVFGSLSPREEAAFNVALEDPRHRALEQPHRRYSVAPPPAYPCDDALPKYEDEMIKEKGGPPHRSSWRQVLRGMRKRRKRTLVWGVVPFIVILALTIALTVQAVKMLKKSEGMEEGKGEGGGAGMVLPGTPEMEGDETMTMTTTMTTKAVATSTLVVQASSTVVGAIAMTTATREIFSAATLPPLPSFVFPSGVRGAESAEIDGNARVS